MASAAARGVGGQHALVGEPAGERLEGAQEPADRSRRQLRGAVLERPHARQAQVPGCHRSTQGREAPQHHPVVTQGGGAEPPPLTVAKVRLDRIVERRKAHACPSPRPACEVSPAENSRSKPQIEPRFVHRGTGETTIAGRARTGTPLRVGEWSRYVARLPQVGLRSRRRRCPWRSRTTRPWWSVRGHHPPGSHPCGDAVADDDLVKSCVGSTGRGPFGRGRGRRARPSSSHDRRDGWHSG